jgi:SagB-type dehydrogenase family enzyme
MKLEPQRVDARTMGAAFSTDRDLALPERPRFIRELAVVPFEEGVLFVGGERPQVLRGRSARGIMERLVPLLDGTRTLAELAVASSELTAEQARDVVSLLHSRGLLEDGAPAPCDGIVAEVGQYLGRFGDVSRANGNRDEALAKLAAAEVGVVGPASLVAQAAAALESSGVGTVRCGVDDARFNLVISTAGEPRRARAGVQTLLVRLGGDEAHLGPMLVPGVTACPECFERIHPHPAGDPDPTMAAYWIGAATTQLVLAISHVVISAHPRGFHVVQKRGGELERSGRVATPLPGCARCGLEGPSIAHDDPALVPWIYHVATALPGREFVSPRAHQMHYAVGNIELAQEERAPVLGTTTVALPPPALDAPGEISLQSLATLLGRAGGIGERHGAPRRLLPTGGNLGSVELWVIARRVDGLPAGIYHYDAPRHRLEAIAGPVDDTALAVALGTDAVPDAAIVTTGALARCAQKYGPFSYRLVHLDSGIALAYAHALAGCIGLDLREVDALNEVAAARLLRLHPRWDYPVPTAAFGLGQWQSAPRPVVAPPVPSARLGSADHADEIVARLLADASAPPPATPRFEAAATEPPQRWIADVLDSVIRNRRAVRAWSDRPLADGMLLALAREAQRFVSARVASGSPPSFVRTLLAVARDAERLPRGLYELDGTVLVRIGELDAAGMRACTNQEGLALSPAAFFVVADLATAVSARGARAYREAAQHAGAAVGQLWLVATRLGLGGTAAGGVLAGGLRAAAGLDPHRACPLLAFHFGWPARSAAVGA